MKKEYKKPLIYFDSFELSQSIAAGCRLISEGEGAPVYDPETGLQVYASGTCTYSPPNIGDEPCYDVPTLDSKTFTS